MTVPAGERAILQARLPAWRRRHRLLQAIRELLTGAGFLEVETPVRIPTPALEDYIDAEPAGDAFLRTSPELHMKRLLAAGCERIFQIGPCFRQGERGRWHRPEFTMLEWYRLEATHWDILEDATGLIRRAVAAARDGDTICALENQTVDFGLDWEILTVAEAFRRYADADLDRAVAAGEFERLLVERIEPHLGFGRPTVLCEYPLACSGLSRPMPARPDRVERWELYAVGIELANACSELTDSVEQAARFERCARLRAAEGRPVYEADRRFLAALERGLPPTAGCAVGIDRLVALAAGANAIAEVTTFAELDDGPESP